MADRRTLKAFLRHRLGTAVHRAGGATRADVQGLHSELQAFAQRLGQFDEQLAELRSELVEAAERAGRDGAARLSALEVLAQIDAVTRFIRHATLRTEPLVSVVLPTCDRPDYLRRAIASVVAQRYERWELLVIDDGGELDSRAIVDEAADSRIQWTRIDKHGVCGARNAALAATQGTLVAYLDDDNLMDPDWLYSVVWAFEQRPEIDVLYGAIVIDDLLRVDGASSGALPRAMLNPWSGNELLDHNLADIGAIAHRSGLPEARFDERLTEMGDWDLLLRLTAERDPLVLPAIACYYTTGAPNRLTNGPTYAVDHASIRARALDRAALTASASAQAGRRVPCTPLTRRPTVSVVIPCHNYARFLGAATASVLTQAAVDVDVLIIDDCSADDSPRVAKALADGDPRVSVITHGRNIGHIATYNEGIAEAQGEYLVLLSADDLLAPGSLARAAALLDAHPSVGFAYGGVVMFDGESVPEAREHVGGWTIWRGRDWIEERCRAGGNTICSPELVMRTSVQQQIGGYRPELPHSADMEMWLRAATVAEVGRIEGADQAFYRVHSESLSSALCPRPTDDLRARHDAFASVLAWPSELFGADRLYALARRSLAAAALRQASEACASLAPDGIDELEAFALEMFPAARETSEWLELDRRRSTIATQGSDPEVATEQFGGD